MIGLLTFGVGMIEFDVRRDRLMFKCKYNFDQACYTRRTLCVTYVRLDLRSVSSCSLYVWRL